MNFKMLEINMRYLFLFSILALFTGNIMAQNATLVGKVWMDNDFNCFASGADRHLSDIIVAANDTTSGQTYYATCSNQSGFYVFSIPQGSYNISLRLPHDFPQASFCQNQVFRFLAASQVDSFDFFVTPSLSCAQLKVELASPGLQDCGNGHYWMRYENTGTITALNTQIYLQLDAQMSLDSADIPFTNLGNGNYLFSIGNLGIGRDSGSIAKLSVSYCATLTGQNYCVKAIATALNNCFSAWSGPQLQVQASCFGDSILFTARNIGSVNMLVPPRTRVIIDDVMYSPTIGQLDTNMVDSFWINTEEGKMYRIEMEQDTLMPRINGGPLAWAAIEGCKTDGQGFFKVGHFTKHYNDDSNPAISYDCQETVPALIYNNKKAETKGFGPRQYISKRIPLEYQIRFQNIGPTIAQSVELIDTLPNLLDLGTLTLGAISHPFAEIKLTGQNLLSIHFPAINLPTQSANPDASFGFANFYVYPRDDAPLGAVIENRAMVVLNYYDTIRTATVYNTIGENFIAVLNTEKPFAPELALRLYPNPVTNGLLNIELSGIEFSSLGFELLNAFGQSVFRNEALTGTNMSVQLPVLDAGIYFYRLSADSRPIGQGGIAVK